MVESEPRTSNATPPSADMEPFLLYSYSISGKITIFPFLRHCWLEFPTKRWLLSVNSMLWIVHWPQSIWANGDHKGDEIPSGQAPALSPTPGLLASSNFWLTGVWSPPSYLFLQFQHLLPATLCLHLSFLPFTTPQPGNIRGKNHLSARNQLCLNIPGLSEQWPCPLQVYADRPVSS